uniref:Uncharacterized protein n=1 Tax=Fagus sylvatica TaxID=28930 RepID=A0A2N9GWB8_FAGSY
MSGQGSGSGGHRRSDRLAKGKAVIYARDSSPDTDDEYDAMEDVRCRSCLLGAARPPLLPGVIIGRSARPSGTTRPSPQPSATTGPSDTPSDALRRPHTRSTGIPPSRLKRQRAEGIPDSAGAIPEDYVAPGFRYPPQGGIRPRYPVAVEISDTPLLTNLLAHPSSLVRRCQDPPESVGRGEVLPSHRGPIHLSTCEMAGASLSTGVPFWASAFGGRTPPSEPYARFRGFGDLGSSMISAAIEGKKLPSVRVQLSEGSPELPLAPDPVLSSCQALGLLLGFQRIDHSYTYGLSSARRWIVSGMLTLSSSLTPHSAALTQRPEVFRAVGAISSEDMDPISEVLGASDGLRGPCGSWVVEGGRVMGGMAMDSHHISVFWSRLRDLRVRYCVSSLSCRSARIVIRLIWTEYRERWPVCRRRRHNGCRGRWCRCRGIWLPRGMQMVARLAATVRRLEEQLQGMGITPVTGAGSSGFGQTSSPPPT